MADGSFPTLVSSDRNSNSATNPIHVRLTDGTDSSLIDASGNLNVIALGTFAEDSVHVSGDNGLQILAVRSDAGGSFASATGDYTPLSITSTGDLRVSLDGETVTVTFADTKVDDSAFTVAVDKVFPAGYLADETATDSVDEGDVGLARMTLDRKVLTRVVGATDANRLDITASGEAKVDITAQTLTALKVSKNSSANSETNPIFVQPVTTAVSGEEIHDYNTGAAIASDATSNHDYTVAGTTFFLRSLIFSASGSIKVEVQTGPVLSLVTKAVGFLGRTGEMQQMFFDPPIEVPVTSTGTVRVIRTNRQGAAMDVYTTIIGSDV